MLRPTGFPGRVALVRSRCAGRGRLRPRGALRRPVAARAAGPAQPGEGEPRLPRDRDEEHDPRARRPTRRRPRPRSRARSSPIPARKPSAVTIVDAGDWRVAVAASALMAEPFRAPILFSDGTTLPGPSKSALDALAPTGSKAAGNAQVIRVGNVARPAGYKSTDVRGPSPLALTRAIAGLIRTAHPRRRVEDHHRELRGPVVRDAGGGLLGEDRRPDPLRHEGRHPARDARRARRAAGLAKPRIYHPRTRRGSSRRRSRRQLKRFGSVERTGRPGPGHERDRVRALPRRHVRLGRREPRPRHGLHAHRPAALRGGRRAAVGRRQLRPAVPARQRRRACRRRCRASCSTRSPRTAPTPSPASTTTAGSSARPTRSRSPRRRASTPCWRSSRSSFRVISTTVTTS